MRLYANSGVRNLSPYNNMLNMIINDTDIRYSKNQIYSQEIEEGSLKIKNASGFGFTPELNAIRDLVLAGEGEHRYSSLMQALLWGYVDRKFKEGDNPLKTYQNPVEFVKPIWGDMEGSRWENFDEVVSRLNRPELLHYYDKMNIFDEDYRGNRKTDRGVFESGRGNCYDASQFNNFCLSKAGYATHLIWVDTNYGDHVIASFEDKGKLYVLDKMGPIHSFKGPYSSFSEMPYDIIGFLE